MRIDELDSLKATALVMMLISNFVTDLNYFGVMVVEKGDFWWWLARSTATLFVGVSGREYVGDHGRSSNKRNSSKANPFRPPSSCR